jgi:16S rRNA (guanine966-N2)-methyltransferase
MSLRIYGNRLLKTLPGAATRPTSARVREAVFNIWQGRLSECRWLDLCTGSGSMGAEALCRGASVVVGVEVSSTACAVIQQNWQQVSGEQQTFRVLRGDIIQRLKGLTGEQFDLIYFDPPYASALYAPVIQAIAQAKLLALHGELAVEHRSDWLTTPVLTLEVCRQKRYGNTSLTFYRGLGDG